MDFQSIVTFLDLVQNPDKFAKALQQLQDEQARLNAVIETVGKASELDSLRKKLDKDRTKFEKTQADRLEALASREIEFEVRKEQLEKDLLEKIGITDKALVDTEVKVNEAQQTVRSYVEREKAIRAEEASIKVQRAELEQKQREIDEKLSKLRSVLG